MSTQDNVIGWNTAPCGHPEQSYSSIIFFHPTDRNGLLCTWPFQSDTVDDDVISVPHVAYTSEKLQTMRVCWLGCGPELKSCLIQSSCTLVEEVSDPPWPQRKCRKAWSCQPVPSLGPRQTPGQCRRRRAYQPPHEDSTAALQSRNTMERTH